jgi:stage II sporulation protein D
VLVALLLLAAGCSAPATRATLPSARSAAPSTIRVGIREGNRITIRKVPLETYVQAAILSEFAPPSGDTDVVERMLEVQAVIGRTYALAHLGRHEAEGFDVCSTTHCQLFEPGRLTTSRWAPQSAEAVRRTIGTVLWFGSAPAEALFHADCGGRTSRADDVWTGPGRPC